MKEIWILLKLLEQKKRKILWVMKLSVFFVLFFSLSVSATVSAQQEKVNLHLENVSLKTFFHEIQKQTGLYFVYNEEICRDFGKVSVNVKDEMVLNVLENVFSDKAYSYHFEEKIIVVKAKTLATPQQQMKKVKGRVTDSKGNPIVGATILICGTTLGAAADKDGKFVVLSNKAEGKLALSAVGFEAKIVEYKEGDELNIVLKEEVNQLNEVSVIAYGERSKRDIVGAISSVKGKDLQDFPNASIETMLQGKMSGVNVSNLSGQPGGRGSLVTIRGFSSLNSTGANDGSPLYVIDGVPVQSSASTATGGINPLASLDPTSIESVDVLKDAASAALYGSRAANGVILITTKKGKLGRSVFNVSASHSFSWLPKTPLQIRGNGERRMYLALAKMQRYGRYDWQTDNVIMPGDYNDTWGWTPDDGSYDFLWNNGNVSTQGQRVPSIIQDSLNKFYNNNTNWWDYVFRTGQLTQANIQISGGNDNVRHLVSAGVYNEKGIMLNSSFMRVNLLTNLDLKLSPKLDAFTRINLAYTDQKAGDMAKMQGMTVDPKTESTLLPGKGTIAEKKVLESLNGIDGKNINYNVRLNIGFNYQIITGLKLSATAALDHYLTHIHKFTPDYLTYNKLTRSESQGIGMTMIQSENMLTYRFDISEKHNFELMAGLSYNWNQLESINGSAQGGPSNQIHYVGEAWPQQRPNEYGGIESLQMFGSNHECQTMLSYYGRIAYNYKKKYLTELTIRSDGSSVFGKDVRWGTFPSVALGWVFSEEAFMKKLWWLNFAKLRLSWGKSGQKFSEAYLAQGIMGVTNSFLGNSGLAPQMLANNKLTWEKSDQYDVGLELNMFNYRIQAKLDYYYKYSSALLMQTPTPGNFFLAKKMWNNASAISNQGIEIEVSGDIIKGDNWNWNLGFNISRNWNLFRKSYNDIDINDGESSKVLGRPVYGVYSYQDEGIVQNESEIPYYYDELGKKRPLSFRNSNYPLRVGGRKIKDQNMDGVIDEGDLYYVGSTIPAAFGGITSRLSWKGITLDVVMNYMIHRKMINIVKGAAFNFMAAPKVLMNDSNKMFYWQKPGDDAEYPSLEFADASYVGQFDGDIDSRVENVNFLRLKQLTLSYLIPDKCFKNKIKGLRVFMTGENLFLISNYSGVDPEMVNPYTGKDFGDQYPLNRKFTIGFNLNF